MHGLLRPLLLRAKPWQRAALGVGLIAVGLATGATILPVLGGVLVIGTAYGAVRGRRSESLEHNNGFRQIEQ
jgi:hypothetical protein